MAARSLALVVFLGVLAACSAPEQAMHELFIHADQGRDTISRHIYGHFAEHLGRVRRAEHE